uniref:Uncharacterized protein n=1 Tax=Meloidogyne floridensis TaxID=298350 RepID=A0A915NMY1_9BILA
MTHCFWGFAINIVIGTYVLLTCDNDDPLMPDKDSCVDTISYGKGGVEVGRFPVLVSFTKEKQQCSRMEYVIANTSKTHSEDKEVNRIYNEKETISKIYVEKLLRGTIYEFEGKITLNFTPVSI